MNLRKIPREKLHESQRGGLPRSSPLKSDGSWDSQEGRGWAAWASAKGNSKEGHQALVHSDQMVPVMARPKDTKSWAKSQGHYKARVYSGHTVLVVVRREAGLREWWPRHSNESQKMTRQPRTYSNGQSDSPTKRVNWLFLRGCWKGEMLMMRWEPLCHHRTVHQQH
jgi:hypothetical protein